MEGRDTESRFSMLLKPIRELADNWNIDVAAELEEYLEDLESVVFSFKGGKSNLNFAEAALMIQGSAVVYSKKVEFLYNLVYETLELLSKQKKQKNEGSKEKTSNRIILDDPVLVMDPSILGEKGNIDLKPDEKDMQRRIAMTNNFKRYSILRLYDSNMGILNSNINKDSKDRSFFLSRCSIGPTGQFTIGTPANTSLLLPSTSHLNTTAHFTTIHVDAEPSTLIQGHANNESSLFGDTEPITTRPPEFSRLEVSTMNQVSAVNQVSVINQSVTAMETVHGVEPSIYEDDPMDPIDPIDTIDPVATPSEHEDSEETEKNAWALVDAFDDRANQNIPYSRGKVFMTKKDVLKKLEKHQQLSSASQQTRPLSKVDDLLYEYSTEEFYVFNRLQSSAKEVMKKYIAAQKPKQTSLRIRNEPVPLDEPEFDAGGLMEMDEDEEILEANVVNEEETQKMLESSRLNVSFTENDVSRRFRDLLNTTMFDPLQLNETEGRSRIETGETGDTYEDLCRQHMEVFMRGVEQFTRETKLVKRVNEWENKIVPILEEQDKHEEFDLHKSRDGIISELKEIKQEVIPVAELAVERQPYQVSRMFVSLLQMANDGTIKIQSDGKCNDMEIQFLNESIPPIDA